MAKEDKSKNPKDTKIRKMLSEQLSAIKPTKEEFLFLNKKAEELKGKIESSARKLKIKAQSFIGGSLAKGTIIKKGRYDLDIFVMFEKQKEKNKQHDISDSLERILLASKLRFQRIHGSRDYFIIKGKIEGKGRESKNVLFEIVPALKITSPKQAENTTDLSFFHVSYIMKQIKKSLRLADDIMLAKSFCHAQDCYGAESYIKGFSGYALELLVCYYKSFLNFIKKIAESKEEIIVIDKERLYKNKQDVLLNMNEAKLQSPIILVDPTFRNRNALAALSFETFERFRKACAEFLKTPSKRFFEKQEINLHSLEKHAKRNKAELIALSCSTDRQAGDVAGSKLLKFFNFTKEEAGKYFDILYKRFDYNGGQNARLYFILKRKKERILTGPPANMHNNAEKFKKEHKNWFVKQGRIFAKEKLSISFNQFFKKFKKQNSKRIKEIGITGIKNY